MDVIDLLIVLVIAGGALALWFLYRKPGKVTYQGQAYLRRKDGSFRDSSGAAVSDPALTAALSGEYDRLTQAREKRIAQASDD